MTIWGGGIFVAKSLNKNVGIRGEVLFSQKGTQFASRAATRRSTAGLLD